MRRLIVTILAGVALALALAGGSAAAVAADHDPLTGTECPPVDGSICVAEHAEEEPGRIAPTSGGGRVFVFFALVWAVPLVLAAAFAARNDENVGTAILLTFFLGWIGLFVVYRGQRRSAAALMRAAEPDSQRFR